MDRVLRASILLASLFQSAGCTKTVVTKIARHELGGPPAAQAAPMDGVYKVKWTSDAKHFESLWGTECLIWKGDRLGFERSPDGGLVAFAGKERIPLEMRLPPDARYCVWYAKERRPTQFGKEVRKALNTGGEIATIGATGALITGAVALDVWADSVDDDDDFNFGGGGLRHHRKHHGHRHDPPATQPAR